LDNLQVEELPMPVPKAGEVLVQVFAAAINPSDAKNVLGKIFPFEHLAGIL
jgi:NADPH2:quinone reductase